MGAIKAADSFFRLDFRRSFLLSLPFFHRDVVRLFRIVRIFGDFLGKLLGEGCSDLAGG